MNEHEFRRLLIRQRELLLNSNTITNTSINADLLEQLARRGVPPLEIASILNVTIKDLENFCQINYNHSFDRYISQARHMMLSIIRNLQMMKGKDVAMLKHLGEWYLDQRSNATGGTVLNDITIQVIYKTAEELRDFEGKEIEDLW
jgi:hypothetical protein